MRNRRRRNRARRKQSKLNMNLVGEILSWAFQIVIVLVFAFVLVYYGGEQISNIGGSMSPTLEDQDVALVNRFIYKVKSPQRGDIVVFKPNGNKNSHFYMKRVVAGPGDTVQIKEGFVYVDEELVTDLPFGKISDPGMAEEPIKVEEDCYFVMGDNPGSSEDSRYADIGNVQLEDIEGKAWYVLSPGERRGKLK